MKENTKEKLEKTAIRLGIAPEQIPRCIAIIMDGNGRWAKERKLPRIEGHHQGAKIVEKIAQHCVNIGIECLILYSFSTENWKRPKAEIGALMYLYTRYLAEIRNTLMRDNVKLVHIGQSAPLPDELKTELAKSIKITAENTGMKLALALNYGSRTELVDATQKIAQEYKNGQLKLEEINEDCISRHLYTAGLAEPDLLIRTAGEMRISNFLLWQVSYCEFYVTETFWPDFKEENLEKAILAYAKRTRHFGNVKSQPRNI